MAYLEEQEDQGFAGSFQQWCQQRLVERFDQFFPPDDLFDDTPEEIVPRWVRAMLPRLRPSRAGLHWHRLALRRHQSVSEEWHFWALGDGRYMRSTWPAPGRYMRGTWPAPGRYMRSTWSAPGRYMRSTWSAPGKVQAISSGQDDEWDDAQHATWRAPL
jgi:hypothetical protein